MRILMYESSGGGGLWDVAWHLSDELSLLGLDMILQTSEGYDRLSNHVPHFTLLDNLLSYRKTKPHLKFSPIWILDRMVRANWNNLQRQQAVWRLKPDLVHIQLILPLIDWLWVSMLSLGVPVIITVHDVFPHQYYSRFHEFEAQFRFRLFKTAKELIVHTEHNKQLLSAFGLDPSHINVIPHGITRDSTGLPSGTDKERARKHLGLPPDRQIVLFFGSLRRNKGLDILINAMRVVVDNKANVLLLVAGSLSVGETFETFTNQIQSLGMESFVETRLGWINEAEVHYYFEAADIVVLPYKEFASQSGVLMKAYAYQRPVIVSNVGSLAETVRKDHVGLVVHSYESDEIGEAVLKLLSAQAEYEVYQNNMKSCCESIYSWAAVARATSRVYEEAVRIS